MSPPLYAGIHRSILSGFLSNIAVHKEKNMYQAAKGREVMIFPGSTLFGKSRPWIVAAEMVQTSRLFARTAAKIDPAWLEELGGDLCRYSYSEPRWDRDRGEVRAKEKVTLFGLEIVSDRDVAFGPKNPGGSPQDIRERGPGRGRGQGAAALPPAQPGAPEKGPGDGREAPAARHHGRPRRPSPISIRGACPACTTSAAWKKGSVRPGGDGFLRMTEKDLILLSPDEAELRDFPDEFSLGEKSFALSYKFSPGVEDDGVTLRVPFGQIGGIPSEALEWGVPGQFRDKIAALIKGLPKSDRKLLMPFAETAETIVREMRLTDPSLYETLARFVKQRFGADIPASRWAGRRYPRSPQDAGGGRRPRGPRAGRQPEYRGAAAGRRRSLRSRAVGRLENGPRQMGEGETGEPGISARFPIAFPWGCS